MKKLMSVLAVVAFGFAIGCNEPNGTSKPTTPAPAGSTPGKVSEGPGSKGVTPMPTEKGPEKKEEKK